MPTEMEGGENSVLDGGGKDDSGMVGDALEFDGTVLVATDFVITEVNRKSRQMGHCSTDRTVVNWNRTSTERPAG
jgi:hypothetical protein